MLGAQLVRRGRAPVTIETGGLMLAAAAHRESRDMPNAQWPSGCFRSSDSMLPCACGPIGTFDSFVRHLQYLLADALAVSGGTL